MDLKISGRDQTVLLSLYVPSAFGTSFAENAIRTSFLAAETALTLSGYQTATVRVLSEISGTGQPNTREVYFITDVIGPVSNRESVSEGSLSEIGKSLRNLWWNRSILSR